MKLLIITQKVDVSDDNLGFFHRWIEKFSQKIEKVFVICLWEGKSELPENAVVLSLGKEKGTSKIFQFLRMQKYLIKVLPEVDGIFVHMCPIYAITSFFLAKVYRKKIVMWYAHAKSSGLAKVSEKLVDAIFTPSRESFEKRGKKTVVTGHGIDVDIFKPVEKKGVPEGIKTIITIGRVAPVKDLKTLVLALDILVNRKNRKNIRLKIVGTPIEEYEIKYADEIKSLVKERGLEGFVEFFGGVPNKETAKLYQNSDIFVNMQAGGGAGKAVLEAMACGLPMVLCTKTYNDLLGDFKDKVIFEEKNSEDFATKLQNCLDFPAETKEGYSALLRKIVVENHNLNNLTDKITGFFS